MDEADAKDAAASGAGPTRRGTTTGWEATTFGDRVALRRELCGLDTDGLADDLGAEVLQLDEGEVCYWRIDEHGRHLMSGTRTLARAVGLAPDHAQTILEAARRALQRHAARERTIARDLIVALHGSPTDWRGRSAKRKRRSPAKRGGTMRTTRKTRTAPPADFSRADNREQISRGGFADAWEDLGRALGELAAAVIRSMPAWLLRYTPFGSLATGGRIDDGELAAIHDDQVAPSELTKRIREQQRAPIPQDAPVQVVVCGGERTPERD